ncbi:MAG TPA: HlyD family efflux transporter periplasmic adaptor subunit [Patescibacteria group bacterium]|nr:HlyD family efflux transporter periplasmic adaptor subunit [Patescibacteria group bacterium]
MSFISNIHHLTHLARKPLRHAKKFIQHYPYRAFFTSLGILLLLIIISNIINNLGKQTTTQSTTTTQVQVYRIGEAPKVTLQAKLQKSGVITIVGQTAGIVQTIHVQEGQQVTKGDWLISLSTNYQGGDALGLQSEIAQKQNQITNDTYQDQKDLIQKQRDLANNTQSNNDQLRNLNAIAATESASLVNQDQSILNSINDQLTTLQNNQTNNVPLPTGSTQTYDQLILQAQELQAQYQGTINQLNQQQNQLSYEADSNQPFTQLQLNQRDITLKQLDIQDKTLDLNRDISNLQLQLAYVNESLMHPAAPCDGVVDRIDVNYGDSVSQGTTLASVSCNSQTTKAVVEVPVNLASTVSRVEPTIIHLGNNDITETPDYVSRDATDGQMYTVIYTIPDKAQQYLTNDSYVTADVPVGLPNTGTADPYIPLDAVYQSQTSAYIFKIVKGKVQSEQINLGNVYGRYVSVDQGLQDGDQIILDRNIVDGEKVTADK